jgi:hypothetical protein
VGPGWQRERGAVPAQAGAWGKWVAWARRGARRAGESWAGNDPTEGGGFSFFFFYFLFLISFSFISFSFEQIIS